MQHAKDKSITESQSLSFSI